MHRSCTLLHALYAGMDPVSLVERYAERIGHLHLKDVDGTVLAGAVTGYWSAVARGVFCPVGKGLLGGRAVVPARDS